LLQHKKTVANAGVRLQKGIREALPNSANSLPWATKSRNPVKI